MTMTPWNLTHGKWSKNLTMATDSLESAPWSIMVKMVILWSKFVVKSKVYHFDHRKFVFRSWSWSKWVFFVKHFVVKIFGWPFLPWKIWISAVVMVEILAIRPLNNHTWLFWNFGHGQKFLTIWPWNPGVSQMVKKSWSPYPPPPPK